MKQLYSECLQKLYSFPNISGCHPACRLRNAGFTLIKGHSHFCNMSKAKVFLFTKMSCFEVATLMYQTYYYCCEKKFWLKFRFLRWSTLGIFLLQVVFCVLFRSLSARSPKWNLPVISTKHDQSYQMWTSPRRSCRFGRRRKKERRKREDSFSGLGPNRALCLQVPWHCSPYW